MDASNDAAAVYPASASEIPLPDGEYAIVEIMGHRTLVGRVEEVERFGSKMMAIEPIFLGRLLPAVMVGGSSLFQFTPCTREMALARAPKETWQLPATIRATLPPALLAGPADDDGEIIDDDGEELPFG